MKEDELVIIKLSKKILEIALSLALLLGCMMSAGCNNAKQEINGFVYASTPVSSAALSIYDTKGKQIFKSDDFVTDGTGVFQIEIKGLPSDFRIVAENGKLYDDDFDAKLCADVRNFNAESDTIYINPVTTLVSAYLDKNPSTSFDDASAAVKNFLEIPESVDIPSGTQLSSTYFNCDQFLTEALENDGINRFIDALLIDMEAGKTHPFQEPANLHGAASWLATTLAEGAVSYVGGELMGWGLDKAGINFGKEDHTAEELAKIQQGMADMKDEMNTMSIHLDAITKQLDSIVNQLKDMLKQISHRQDLSDYGNRVLLMNDLISSVNSIQRDLNRFVSNPPTDPEPMRKSLINRIESNIIDRTDVINNQLVGLAGEKPLLTLWREIVYEDRYLDSDDYDRVKAQYDFFKQYQDAILLLQVEYYHAIEVNTGDNAQIIMDCIDEYETHMAQQEALMVLPIEKDTVVDTKWDGMYYSKNITLGKTDDSFALTGKTKNQVQDYMSELANSNYAGFNDWKVLDYDSFGALTENYITGRSSWNWSEFMIDQGWPGVKIDRVIVPFYDLILGSGGTKLVYMLNDSSHFKNTFDYPETGLKNSASAFSMVMAYRQVNAKDYGYQHLK